MWHLSLGGLCGVPSIAGISQPTDQIGNIHERNVKGILSPQHTSPARPEITTANICLVPNHILTLNRNGHLTLINFTLTNRNSNLKSPNHTPITVNPDPNQGRVSTMMVCGRGYVSAGGDKCPVTRQGNACAPRSGILGDHCRPH